MPSYGYWLRVKVIFVHYQSQFSIVRLLLHYYVCTLHSYQNFYGTISSFSEIFKLHGECRTLEMAVEKLVYAYFVTRFDPSSEAIRSAYDPNMHFPKAVFAAERTDSTNAFDDFTKATGKHSLPLEMTLLVTKCALCQK